MIARAGRGARVGGSFSARSPAEPDVPGLGSLAGGSGWTGERPAGTRDVTASSRS
jgi:hypothetical protein